MAEIRLFGAYRPHSRCRATPLSGAGHRPRVTGATSLPNRLAGLEAREVVPKDRGDVTTDPVLLERSGIEVTDAPAAHLALGREACGAVGDPAALLAKIDELEQQRR